eukprot:1136201-Pelagomonas_calceolata.AAC.2
MVSGRQVGNCLEEALQPESATSSSGRREQGSTAWHVSAKESRFGVYVRCTQHAAYPAHHPGHHKGHSWKSDDK